MLEVFEKLEGKDEMQKEFALIEASKKYPNLHKLLRLYICNQEDEFIGHKTIFKMMRYYKVENNWDIGKIGEIGNFAATRIEILKRKEFRQKPGNLYMTVEMSNVDYLINTYKKLKINISYKKQYKILKSCLLLLNKIDVKWFVRLLCKRVKITKGMIEYVKKMNIYEED